ncbi:ATP synthase F1 subunit delta [Atopobium sp. oral taxon 416]|uniref:ATP synthase F1 subunit delta n=1 Tax=Atopobium sp. oral taxon 416 TaxID=712157 RepID=UPI001BA9A248|nr:ATP synthase F1 subunit delta [Atopobium sp. oral taxon 416]QUC03216.1 ATP synthase F1 subunit delta [Atopobium sp. oral taxon 416]
MPNRDDEEKVEAYTRALLNAARSEGRANADLVQWQHAVKFTPEVLETLTAMRSDNDQDLVRKVADQYQTMMENDDETVTVTVTTAIPLDDEMRDKIIKKFEKQLKSPVYLVSRVDSSIIGGIIVSVNGHRYDASVKAQLANIRKKLSSTFIGSDE